MTLTAGANATIAAFNTTDTVELGDIFGGPTGSLTFDGGTFNSFGAHGYTGPVTLLDDTTLNLTFMDSDFTLSGNNSRLGGYAFVGDVTAQSGSTVAPGNSPGIINTGNFALMAGSTLEIELGGSATNPGVDYDQVNVTGSVTLGGDLDAVLYSNVTGGEEYVIINNDGVDPVVGTFNGLAQGATVEIGGRDFTIRYDGDAANPGSFGGNDVVLTPAFSTFYDSIWDGGGDGTSWEDPINWAGDTLPGLADNVLIDAFGTSTTVTLTSGNEIVTNIFANEKLQIDGGDLQIDSLGRFDGGLDLLSGFLYTNGTTLDPAQVNIGGSSNWQGGTIEGIGPDPDDSVATLFGGTLTIDGGGTLDFTNISFDNQSNTVHDSVTINLSSAGIINQPGGVYEMRGATIDDFGGASFINTNQLIVEGGTTSTIDAFFWNNEVPSWTGSVNVANGTLNIEGTVQNATATTLNNEGTWEVGNGSALTFSAEPNLTENQGNVTLRGTGNFTNFNSVTTNSGTFNLADGATFGAGGNYTNTGTVSVDSTSEIAVVELYTQNAGTTSLEGNLRFISFGSAPAADFNGGTLTGDGGSIDGFGTGFAAAITLDGTTLDPGIGGAGVLDLENVTLGATSTTNIELTDGAAGVDYDTLLIGGATINAGATLNLSPIGVVTPGQSFTIIDGGGAVTGTFAGAPEGGTVSDGTNDYTITYSGGLDGFDVVLTAQASTTPTEVQISGGNLAINDADGNNDNLVVTTSGSNYVITDAGGNNLFTTIATATGSGTPTITVPFDEVTTTNLNFDLGDGDDLITIGGTFAPSNLAGDATDQFLLIVDGQGGNDSITWAGASTLNVINLTAESITQSGNSTSTANQTWDGPVTLAANVSTSASTLFYESTIDGAQQLTVSASGAIFKDSVGATTPLTGFQQSGIAEFRGTSITTTGDLLWNGDLNLDSPTDVVTMNAVGLVGFGTASSNDLRSVTDGEEALIVNTPGVTAFNAQVGHLGPRLRSLTTDAGGSVITSFQLHTTEDVTFNDAVSNRLQTVTVRDLNFNNAVNGFGAIPTGITATGNVTFSSGVGSPTPVPGFNILDSTSVTVDGAVNIGANGFLAISSGQIMVAGAISAATTGPISLTTERNILLDNGAGLTVIDGNLTLSANQQTTPTAGNFTGIEVSGTITTTNSSITLAGKSGDSANNHGVHLNGGTVQSTGAAAGAATITISGTTTNAADTDEGLRIEGASVVTSVSSDISLTGNANLGRGIHVLDSGVDSPVISSTGTGASAAAITLDGTQSFSGGIQGVLLTGTDPTTQTQVTSADGAIQITGTGGGPGVDVDGDAVVSSTGTATISIDGTSARDGVRIQNDITTVDGAINITGTGSADDGVEIFSGGLIDSTGAGTITVTGTSTGSSLGDEGLIITSGIVRSVSGDIVLTGVANGEDGVDLSGGAAITSAGTGVSAASITIDGSSTGSGLGADIVSATVSAQDGAIQITGNTTDPDADGVSVTTIVISNAGTIALGSDKNITIGTGGSVTSSDGDITLSANQQAIPTSGDFHGIEIANPGFAGVESANGNIVLQAKSGNSANNHGVFLNNSRVVSTGTGASAGTITITGEAVSGTGSDGVRISGNSGTVNSVDGDIAIDGDSLLGAGFAGYDGGIFSTGTGVNAASIVVDGDSTGATSAAYGSLLINSFNLQSDSGDITVTGDSDGAHGISVDQGADIDFSGTGTGTITLSGMTTASGAAGAIFGNPGSELTTTNANVIISGSAVDAPGVSLGAGYEVIATGTGSVELTGGAPIGITIGNGAGPATITTASGTVSTNTGADVVMTNGSTISADGGFSAISPSAGFTMASGTSIDSASGDVDIDVITDITIGDIDAATNVDLSSLSGEVVQLGGAVMTLGGSLNVSSPIGLTVNGTIPTGYTIPTGNTLNGTGTIVGGVTAQSGSIIAPGNSPGILNTGNFDLVSGSTLEIEIGGTTAGNTANDHDQVNVTGTVTLAGTLDTVIFNAFVPTISDQFTIINNDLADAVTGTFAGLAEGATVTDDVGNGYTISYVGGDGNDVVLTSTSVAAATVTVINTNDSGAGSLRQAILDSNAAPGADVIEFNIPGSGPHTITPSSALPAFDFTTVVDGFTQTGASPNTLADGNDASIEIILDGSVAGGTGLNIGNSSSSVRGLSFVNWGIGVETGFGGTIAGNFIGVMPDGSTVAANSTGIYAGNQPGILIGTDGDGLNDFGERNVISGSVGSEIQFQGSNSMGVVAGNFIGVSADGTAVIGNSSIGVQLSTGANTVRIGTDGSNDAFNAAERNVISGHGNTAISGGTNMVIAGNYIGTDVFGTTALGNSSGIVGSEGRIGTNADGIADALETNLISGNTAFGLLGSFNDTTIAGNLIGTDITGTLPLGNGSVGIQIGGSNTTIGGTTAIERNIVSGNTGPGIVVTNAGLGVEVLGNYIGTDVTGSIALANTEDGIRITNSSPLISNNIVSGNAQDGIELSGTGDGIDDSAVLWLKGENDFTDEVGANDGTNVGGVTFGVGVDGGQAFEFNGSTQHIDIADDPSLTVTNAVTVEAWINPDTLTGGSSTFHPIASKYNAQANAVSWLFTAKGDGGLYFSASSDGTASLTALRIVETSGSVLTLGQYQHVAATFDTATQDVQIYVDGVSVPVTVTRNATVSSIATTSTPVRIGAFRNNPGQLIDDFDGRIDEPAVYDTVLSPTAIAAIHAMNGTGKKGAVIEGNTIGLNANGDAALGNTDTGIRISSSVGNIIGDSTGVSGNVIAGNASQGILLNSSDSNAIAGNSVGDATFATQTNGIELQSSDGNLIGGDGATAGNAITAATSNGIFLSSSDDNFIYGNAITDNAGVGVNLNASAGNTIGGYDAVLDLGNAITGNSTGIHLQQAATQNNLVSGNAITGNTANGVLINVGASLNTIGTDGDGTNDANEGNLISDNQTGILITGSGTDGNLVQGNFIGTDATGLVALPNTLDGIRVADSAANNIIGGEIFATGNVISGNTRHGVYVTGTVSGTQISGNFIGASATGNTALGNLSGVVLEGFNNIVGVVDNALQGNLISGNLDHGVLITAEAADGNRISGNLIGTDQNGTAGLDNQRNGIWIQTGPDNNIIGTDGDGNFDAIERNIIAGNGLSGAFDGVLISGASTDGNVIAGNLIGVDFNGNSAIGNTRDGVRVSNGPTNTTIGGVLAEQRNVISGNANNGVTVTNSDNNILVGNYIGTDSAGMIAVPNAEVGVEINFSDGNRIGTDADGNSDVAERNIISGNSDDGIWVRDSSSNVVAGNYIGADATGNGGLGNRNGITFQSFTTATNNRVGGPNSVERNVIVDNSFIGISMSTWSQTRDFDALSGNVVQGNYVGVGADGNTPLGNGLMGIYVYASGNTIGGSLPGGRECD